MKCIESFKKEGICCSMTWILLPVSVTLFYGLSGWGSYDTINEFFPYWGLSGGSIIRYLNNQGYESYAASVDPTGSAWDRACELYAQLAGTRVDYGLAHSQKAGHSETNKQHDTSAELIASEFSNLGISVSNKGFN